MRLHKKFRTQSVSVSFGCIIKYPKTCGLKQKMYYFSQFYGLARPFQSWFHSAGLDSNSCIQLRENWSGRFNMALLTCLTLGLAVGWAVLISSLYSCPPGG